MVARSSSPRISASEGLKLGDLIRDAFPALWKVPWLNWHQRSVLFRMSRCGTGALGYTEFGCRACRSREHRPLGCQDRHCPSCGVRRREEWAQARLAEVIDGPCFHLVFTVPGELYGLFRDNQEELYSLFFSGVNETLATFAADAKYLGGTPAFFSILHTTNRRLGYHPHVHVVISGSAFNEARGRLVQVKKDDFLFPARALASSFRGRFLTGLRELANAGKLDFIGKRAKDLANPGRIETLISKLFAKNWQVRTDAATGQAERVIRYLARYTNRTAISNARIVRYEKGQATYISRDSKTNQRRSDTLPLLGLVRRFAQHILPKRFRRIRFYGLLSPAKRRTLLVRAQAAARHLARLRGLQLAVRCSLTPERPPPLCCEACGAEGLVPIAVVRGSKKTLINTDMFAIPPPRPTRPATREAR